MQDVWDVPEKDLSLSLTTGRNIGRSALSGQGCPLCTNRETSIQIAVPAPRTGFPVSVSRDLSVPPHSRGTCRVSLQFSQFHRFFKNQFISSALNNSF